MRLRHHFTFLTLLSSWSAWVCIDLYFYWLNLSFFLFNVNLHSRYSQTETPKRRGRMKMGHWVALETILPCEHLHGPNAALYFFVFTKSKSFAQCTQATKPESTVILRVEVLSLSSHKQEKLPLLQELWTRKFPKKKKMCKRICVPRLSDENW